MVCCYLAVFLNGLVGTTRTPCHLTVSLLRNTSVVHYNISVLNFDASSQHQIIQLFLSGYKEFHIRYIQFSIKLRVNFFRTGIESLGLKYADSEKNEKSFMRKDCKISFMVTTMEEMKKKMQMVVAPVTGDAANGRAAGVRRCVRLGRGRRVAG